MSEVLFNSLVRITAPPPRALLVLRGDAAVQNLALGALGLTVPGQRRIVAAGGRMAGWMAPDEVLILLPPEQLAPALADLRALLEGQHHLLADISDSRALFRLEGRRWREVLAKAVPVDLAPGRFEPGELRRSHAGQVAVAFWAEGADAAMLICMRSVAGYLRELLATLARPGSEVGLFD